MWWWFILGCGQPQPQPEHRGGPEQVVDVARFLQDAEREVRWVESAAAWRVLSSDVRVMVDDDGAALSVRGAPESPTTRLSLVGVGRQSPRTAALERSSTTHDELRLERQDGVQEWFVSLPQGVEHGFTLTEAPAGGGPLSVWLHFDRQVTVSPRAVRTRVGGAVLSYDDLHVWDTDEVELSSRFALDGCDDAGCTVRIEVDDAGAAWPVTIDPLVHVPMLVVDDFPSPSFGGWSVDSDGDWAIIGVPGLQDSAQGYVDIRSRNVGGPDAFGLTARLDETTASFGRAVAIDMPYAAVGAPEAGMVFVYEWDGTDWVTSATLTGDPQFGASLALGGLRLAVGDPQGETVTIYTYERPGTGWSREEVLDAPQPGVGFPTSLDLDDRYLVVGAPNPGGDGSVFVFDDPVYVAGGQDNRREYILTDEIRPQDDVYGASFGVSVALYQSRVAIGAPGLGRGAAYLFEVAQGGGWTEAVRVDPPPGDDITAFGAALASVGPYLDVMGTRSGMAEVHFFEDTSEVPEPWGYVDTVEVGAAAPGEPLAVATADHLVITGVPMTQVGTSNGVVTLFRRGQTGWTPSQPDLGLGQGDWGIGTAVAIAGDHAAVGAPQYDGNGQDAGAVVFLHRQGSQWGPFQVVEGAAAGDRFGHAVDLSNDRAIVASPTLRQGDGGGDLLEFDGASWARFIEVPVGGCPYSHVGCGASAAIDGETVALGTEDGAVVVMMRNTLPIDEVWLTLTTIEGAVDGATGSIVALDDHRLVTPGDGGQGIRFFDQLGGYDFVENPESPKALGEIVSGLAVQDDQIVALGETKFRVWRQEPGIWRRTTVALPANGLDGALAAANDDVFVGIPTEHTVYHHSRNHGGADAWNLVSSYTEPASLLGTALAADNRTVVAGAGSGKVVFLEGVANNAPHAYDDHAITPEDTEIRFNVLDNDRDPNGDVLTVLNPRTDTPELALVFEIGPDGELVFMPAENICTDGEPPFRFTYDANDGEFTASAMGEIEVTCVNDAPSGSPDLYAVDEDGTLDVAAEYGVLANDSDPDNLPEELRAEVADSYSVHGELTLYADGALQYKPTSDYFGTASFTYIVNDGEVDSEPVLVTIEVLPVNDPPIAGDFALETLEGERIESWPPGLAAYVTDIDSSVFRFEKVADPSHGGAHVFADGGYIYTPGPGFVGTDVFSYKVFDDDGAESAPATITVTVRPVNDAPVAVDDAYSLAEDSVLVKAALDGVLANDSDPDNEVADLKAVLVSNASNGTVGYLKQDGGFEYRPDANFHGEDQFTYTVSDPSGELSNEATVRLYIQSVNDAPTAQEDLYFLDQGAELVVDIAADGVLANDADPDGDLLTAVPTQVPRNGLVDLGDDGTFTYTPDLGFRGSDSFGYLVTDGELSSLPTEVTIRVNVGGSDTGGPGTGPGLEDTACEPMRLYLDQDGDGYGSSTEVELACGPREGLAEQDGDCDDTRADVYPGAREVVDDGLDQDCNGTDGQVVPEGTCSTGGQGALWVWPLVLVAVGRRRRSAPLTARRPGARAR